MGEDKADQAKASPALRAALSPDDRPSGAFPLLPWSLLGMGLLIAWLCCTHLAGMFVSTGDVPGDSFRTPVSLAMRVGDIGTFLAVIALGRRAAPLSRRPRACLAVLLASGVASLLAPAAARLGSMPLACACGALAAIGGAVAFVLWAEDYAQLGPTRATLFGALSCVTAGLVALVCTQLTPIACDVAIAAMLPVSGACALVNARRLSEREAPVADDSGARASREGDGTGTGHARVPWKLVLIMAVAGFVSGFVGTLFVPGGVGSIHRVAATVVFGVAALAMLGVGRGHADLRWFAWLSLPIAVAAFLAIPLVGSSHGQAVSFLVKLAYVWFTCFVLLDLCGVTYRLGVSATRVFATARASSELAILLGILTRMALVDAGVVSTPLFAWLATIVGLIGTIGCVVLWASERSVKAEWNALGIPQDEVDPTRARRARILGRCDELAARAGLTPREVEVLALVAQGLSSDEIERELFVSHNTYKTHVRHIYAKLGVHTREEAVALVEQA